MPADKSFRSSQALSAVVARCWDKCAAPVEWNLSRDQFHRALERSAAHRFPGQLPDDRIVAGYLESLHLADLALACACSAAEAAAWEYFIEHYRPELHRAARIIVSKSSGNKSGAGEAAARELADSLYGDLFGVRESPEGARRSLFDYFHGRSKLTTWLHAILAQRQIDQIRRAQKTDSLDEPSTDGPSAADSLPSKNSPPDPERNRYLALLQACLTDALGALPPRDRLRLAYYYVDELTLAEIGKLLGEHEATASRKLERTRSDLRRCVEEALRIERKLSDAELRLCFEYAREEWPFDLTRALSAPD